MLLLTSSKIATCIFAFEFLDGNVNCGSLITEVKDKIKRLAEINNNKKAGLRICFINNSFKVDAGVLLFA
jgi:hypothetical protein